MTYPNQPPLPHPGQGYPGQPAPGPAGQPAPGQPAPERSWQPAPIAPTGEPLASFTDRLIAWIIDGVILGALAVVFLVPFMVALLATLANRAGDLEAGGPDVGITVLAVIGGYGLLLVLLLAASYIYSVLMMYRTGQTIGKRVMKIRVTTLDGRPLTHGAAAKRWGVVMLAGLIPAGQLVDGLWQLWDQPLRQCLHDKAAATTVVRLVPGAPARGGAA